MRKRTEPFRPNEIAECNFGIELELSTSAHVSAGEVARVLGSHTSIDVKDLTEDFVQARNRTDICSKFELVSPVLAGGSGIAEVDQVLKALGTISSVEVGRSMGFHVHVDVSKFSCKELAKVCQNFLRIERAMDSFMPPSRREDVQQYCMSNEKVVESAALSNCETLAELASVMNPGEHPGVARYYKLNLQNLVTGRQPTIEFRQHSGTSNGSKIKNWVMFCVAFVHNSVKLDDASLMVTANDDDHLFEMIMVDVINDRYLRDFYRNRRNELYKDHHGEGGGSCCEGCAARGQCAAKFLPV
jgi:hypothetical protein